MTRRFCVLFASILVCAASSALPAHAEGSAREGWAFGLGVFDYLRDGTAIFGSAEYRSGSFDVFGVPDCKAAAGVAATAEGAVYGYVGLRYDLELGKRWFLTPNFAVVLYEEGGGKDLGGPLQFRSGVELAYRLDSGRRLGLHFHHISNSRIYDFNPGEESLVLFYSFGR